MLIQERRPVKRLGLLVRAADAHRALEAWTVIGKVILATGEP